MPDRYVLDIRGVEILRQLARDRDNSPRDERDQRQHRHHLPVKGTQWVRCLDSAADADGRYAARWVSYLERDDEWVEEARCYLRPGPNAEKPLKGRTYLAVCQGTHPDDSRPVYVPTLGPPATMLVQLTGKCYFDGSGSRDVDGCPDGDGLNCDPVEECEARFIRYSWQQVADADAPVPVDYSEVEGGLWGSFHCFPVYHESNDDLPVYPWSSPLKRYAGVAEEDASAGVATWSGVDDARLSDDLRASSALASTNQETRYLKLTGFCFALPYTGVSVTNVEVRVEAHASAAASVEDVEVKLVVGGAITGTNKSANTALGASDAVRSYSYTPTQWGVNPLDVVEVNRENFGCALRYKSTSGARTVRVDSVEIRVSFSVAGAAGVARSIVRVRRGAGDYYLTEQRALVDLFRRTGESDAGGEKAYLRYYDPNAGEWRDGEEVRLVEAG